jgi:hypothetical protein
MGGFLALVLSSNTQKTASQLLEPALYYSKAPFPPLAGEPETINTVSVVSNLNIRTEKINCVRHLPVSVQVLEGYELGDYPTAVAPM